MLLGEKNDLRNRIIHVDWEKVADSGSFHSIDAEAQSANIALWKTVQLQEKGILQRMNGRRNGRWVIVE